MDAETSVVMVLDDSEDDRFFTIRALKKNLPGVALQEFSYAEDALSFLRSPDRPTCNILLVDINMPRMDGFEFADHFLELYPELRSNAHVFITSSSLNPADRDRAQSHPGVAGYIEKPFNRESVQMLVTLSNGEDQP